LLHLADIWQNRKDVTNMARKVVERNISYDDIRKNIMLIWIMALLMEKERRKQRYLLKNQKQSAD